MKKTAIIAGAGPAGLTAALELLRKSEVVPMVFEMDSQVGGISKTVSHNGNRMDLGGHRFFSKSDWVMKWWQDILPVESDPAEITLGYHNRSKSIVVPGALGNGSDKAMLVRPRLSRIYYRRRFFDYPLKLNYSTLSNLGAVELLRIGASYARSRAFPFPEEISLEHFLVNRFGQRLYETFFRDYTEKVWGVPCSEISAEWGAQRIKGLSISKAITHALLSMLSKDSGTAQKQVETSLIERFLYPKFGPGQMWEEVSSKVKELGGDVRLQHKIVGLIRKGPEISAVEVEDLVNGSISRINCDYFLSTMPVQQLVAQLRPENGKVERVAQKLPYRDFMTAGLLVRNMTTGKDGTYGPIPPDNWIYIQEPDVKLGRLQIFNNWSPYMVSDPKVAWLGLEYFCAEGDELWARNDPSFLTFAASELEKIGLARAHDVIDGKVVRVPKAYPAYFGEYKNIHVLRNFLDGFSNLYAIGRNGMHRYNNQDHSMLAARAAVECILQKASSKESIWAINAEEDYHEESKAAA